MNDQSTNTVLMVRPFFFRSNEQTAVNNYYQSENVKFNLNKINELVISEFERVRLTLENKRVKILTFQDHGVHDTPDSIFPNNWFSTTANAQVVLYPMFAVNRRYERNQEVISFLEENYLVKEFVDFSIAEERGNFLEGTGSLVLDHLEKKAYCCFSQRSSPALFRDWCAKFEYTPLGFHAYQTVNGGRELIYHTNVMLSIGTNWVVCCLEAIDDFNEKKQIKESFKNKTLIEISESQVENFCGNILELRNQAGEKLIVMSKRAKDAFNSSQLSILNKFGEVIAVDVTNIEKYGGGGVRCMLAEVFLTLKS